MKTVTRLNINSGMALVTGMTIQIKYGLPYSVTCLSMSTDPGFPTFAPYPGSEIPGSVRILGQVTQFLVNMLNLHYTTVFILFWYHHCAATGILCQRVVMSSSWKCWPVIRSTAHHTLLHQPLLLLHSMTLTAEKRLKHNFKKFCWGFHLYYPLTTCYQYAVDGKYCTLCFQIVWMLHGASRHEARWKPALFTSNFWSGRCLKVAFPAPQR